MKKTITLSLLCFFLAFSVLAQEKRQTKFVKFEDSAKYQLSEASQIIKDHLQLSSDDDLVKIKSEVDQLGFIHETYQQYFQGIKVEFGIYKAHAKNGNLKSINGELFSAGKLNISPSLTNSGALEKAIKSVGATQYLWDSPEEAKLMDNYKKPEGELVIFPGKVINQGQSRLAYKFDIYALQPISRAYIYVDAHNGEVIFENAIIKHADDNHGINYRKNETTKAVNMPLVAGNAQTRYSGTRTIETSLSGSSYRLRETSRGNGIETYDMNMGINYNNAVDFTDNDNNWTTSEHATNKDDAALDAHWGAEMTYDYFQQTFNRNSFDNNGAVIRSYVHFDLVEYGYSNQDNAFWNGSVMTYGDGTSFDPLTSLDIAAHEIGHAICENTANLVYSYESGAMNEGFSDIWAASVEYFADPTKQTWLLAEEIGGPIRSLSNPNAYGQPDTYQGTNWYTGSGDNGGVHYNSGVLNHWFYILSVGQSGTNDIGDTYSVSAIGIDKAAAIAYRLESQYLTSSSQYSNARTGGIQAAEDLYGAGSAEVIATTNAFYAVGIGSEYVQTCALGAPSALAGSSINDNGFTLSWNSVSGAVSYTVSVNGTSNTVSGTSYTVTGLTPGTSYTSTVVANCSVGGSGTTASTSVTTTGTAPLNYCTSASTNINDEYIGRVQLGSIDNSSGGQFYTDFTNVSTNLTKSVSNTITVTPVWTGTVYSEGYSVWIDYNQDGDFGDSGEQVWSQSATQTTPVNGSFSVPTSATNGTTRMRVSMKYNGVPTSCETFTYGEVEDYTVNIITGAADTIAPVIALNGASTINLTQGDAYNELGATATDNVDGNLTSSIVVTGTVDTNTVGTYSIFYNVSDAAGNAATEVERTVNVSAPAADTTAPVIALNGASTISLTQGDAYNELGATATDNVDGDLTSSIVVTGTVDTNIVGTYAVFYNVSDTAGNAAIEVERTVNVSAPAADTQAPTTPTALTASSITQTTAILSWNASSDNVGVTGYEVFSSGSSIGTFTNASTSLSGLTASTAYTYTVTAFDAAGNVSSTSNSVSFTTLGNGGGNSTTTLHEGYFESGWDGWSDGGSDCARYSGSRSYEGSYSIRIRDNSGTSSSMTSPVLNLSGYDTVEVEFYFYAYSMENNEDFWLRYYNGSSWSTVATWARGTSFNNNTFYSATVNLSATDYALVSNGQFRFQCDASANGDQIYIDQVTIKGINGTGILPNTINSVGSGNYGFVADVDSGDQFEYDFQMYPNPVKDVLNIKLLDQADATYRVVNVLGQEVMKGQLNQQSINVSQLQNGMYIIEVNDGEEVMIRKFIKK